jgi:RNA polymerase sigma factor (TIGR02999 family)
MIARTAGDAPAEWNQLTILLNRLGDSGDVQDRVYKLVYSELRRIAQRLANGESSPASLRATELLHETYLKKLRNFRMPIRSRRHFYALATRAMRQVLIEQTRLRKADKRQPVASPWIFNAGGAAADPERLLQIAPILDALREIDARAASVVDIRFFLGCSLEETAEVLGVSVRNVRDDWDFARLWLKKQLET